jgi:hypothetical protein
MLLEQELRRPEGIYGESRELEAAEIIYRRGEGRRGTENPVTYHQGLH